MTTKTSALVERARELRSLRHSWKSIADTLDCDPSTVRCWIDENFHQKHLERERVNRRKREAEHPYHEPPLKQHFHSNRKAAITLAPVPPRRSP